MKWTGLIRICVTALLLAHAAPAAAQKIDASPWRETFRSCVAGSDPETLLGCEGRVAEACMEDTPGGLSTLGMVDCIQIETILWDEVLNAEWGPLMARVRAEDDAEREVFGDQFSRRAESLREAQRAWIAFRDAECAFAYDSWGSGSLRTVGHAGCALSMTADRVARLREIGQEGY